MTRTIRDRVQFWRHADTGIELLQARFGGHAYDRHAHDTYAIGVTLRGGQGFHHRGRRHVSTPGTVIAMNPEDAHDGSAETEDGFSYWMLYPSAELWTEILGDAAGRRTHLPFFTATLIDDPCCREHLLNLCRTLVDPAAGSLESDCSLTQTLTALARRHGRTPPPAPLERNDPAVQRVHGLLHHEYQRELRLEDLAREAGRSRFWVNRAFAAAYGLPPHTYLTRRRLESARRMLAHGEPAAEVAAAVGFTDQSHLIRRFKASYGITPGAFQAACTVIQSTT